MVTSTAPFSTDGAYQRLHSAGWSVGDVCFLESGWRVWTVFCHRGEQQIVAQAASQLDAWVRASMMAASMESERWMDSQRQPAG